tara:strand:+ start:31963 stop:32403 length:441 start_codon:yes stop_codon:yes gene_type:complete
MYLACLAIVLICWTISPFVKKFFLQQNLTPNEYMVTNDLLVTFLTLCYLSFLLIRGKYDYEKVYHVVKNNFKLYFIGGSCTFLGALLFIYVVSKEEASNAVLYTSPIVIALTVIIGYLFFNEQMSLNKIVGSVLIVLGLVTIQNGK